MKLLYKLPSRSRPEKFFKAVENIIQLAKHDNYVILATLDTNDKTMSNPDVSAKIRRYPCVKAIYGRSTGKINAVNRDISLIRDWDILISSSDDMEFIKPGFDLDIIKDMPNDLDAVIHYPDGYPHDEILSLPVIGRTYFERFGYIYNPVYQSLFCDEEAIIIADRLGKLVRSRKNIVRHNHPAWGVTKSDAQYVRTEALYPVDKRTFLKRKAANFPITLIKQSL